MFDGILPYGKRWSFPKQKSSRHRRSDNLGYRLKLEVLEERTTPSVFLVRNIQPDGGTTLGSVPRQFIVANDTLYFTAYTDQFGEELWRTDGTGEGTRLVVDLAPGRASALPEPLLSIGNTLYFAATHPSYGRELWCTTGTAASTRLIRDIHRRGNGFIRLLTTFGGNIYFVANDGSHGAELWKTDGTHGGTQLVRDLVPGSDSGQILETALVGGSYFYFTLWHESRGFELWKTDGTSGGTVMLRNFGTGPLSAELIAHLTNVNGTLYFSAVTNEHGRELWKSDGSSAGTVLVRDILSGPSSSIPNPGPGINMANYQGTLFFPANNGGSGVELFKSDGTSSGTVLVKDIRAGYESSHPRDLLVHNERLFFVIEESSHRGRLWTSQGSESTTYSVPRLGSFPYHPQRLNFSPISDRWLFVETADGHFLTDGAAIIAMLRDLESPHRLDRIASQPVPTPYGQIFFLGRHADLGTELWGARLLESEYISVQHLVRDIRPGSNSGFLNLGHLGMRDRFPGLFHGGTLFFAANDGTQGVELWAADLWAPRIVSITLPSPGVYHAGDVLEFTVRFDERVFVRGQGEKPRLPLRIGAETRYAEYVSGSRTDSLVFRYTVRAADADSDGITFEPGELDLGDYRIQDGAGHDAAFLGLEAETAGILVNATGPRILSVQAPGYPYYPQYYRQGNTLTFSVQFDEPVIVSGTPRLALMVGGIRRWANYHSGSGTDTLSFSYVVQHDDHAPEGIVLQAPIYLHGGSILAASDHRPAALGFAAPLTNHLRIDQVPPTVVRVLGPAPGKYGSGSQLFLQVVFDEPVQVANSGSAVPQLGLSVGTQARVAHYHSQLDPNTLQFVYTVASTDLGSLRVVGSLHLPAGTSIHDAGNNTAVTTFEERTFSEVVLDGVRPVIQAVTPPPNNRYTTGQRLTFRVQFSEDVAITGPSRPFLNVRIGSAIRRASFARMVNARTMEFTYTITASDRDTDGIQILSPLQVPHFTFIHDLAGNSAILTFTPPDTRRVFVN
ncbi:MAG: hypothetical protein RMJ82_14790 [Gemmatales bacterium]|nr:hypothetical protein [Gemmatales bacterium]